MEFATLMQNGPFPRGRKRDKERDRGSERGKVLFP